MASIPPDQPTTGESSLSPATATHILGSAPLTAEPEPLNVSTPDRATPTIPYDGGYVPRGCRRTFRNGQWAEVPDETRAPPDIYADSGTFGDREATVQVVTFYKEEEKRAKWEPPLKLPWANEKLQEVLKDKGDTEKTWRWIHCEGLHGPTLRTIAQQTGKYLPIRNS